MKTKSLLPVSFLLGSVMLLLPGILKAQEDFIDKHVKEYKIEKGTVLNLENKYGNIDIRDWDRDVIKIDVEIKLSNVSKQKADQIFQKVNIEFSEEGSTISAKTDYDEDFFKLIGKSGDRKDDNFEVNYVVMLPVYTTVNVFNKYGNIFVSKLTSPSSINLKYGTLKINQLLGENKEGMANIDLAYSKGNMENGQWVKLASKYSTFTIQECKALIAISKYSKLFIEKGTSLICESKYDTYSLGSLSNFVTESQYSNFRIEKVSNKISLETRYTDVKIERIPTGFEVIDVDNSYGSVRLGIDPGASYKLDAEAKYAKINYPENSRVSRFQENSEQKLEGRVGPESEPKSVVKIETRYGGINLQ